MISSTDPQILEAKQRIAKILSDRPLASFRLPVTTTTTPMTPNIKDDSQFNEHLSVIISQIEIIHLRQKCSTITNQKALIDFEIILEQCQSMWIPNKRDSRRRSLSMLCAWLSEFLTDLAIDAQEEHSALKKKRILSKTWLERFYHHHQQISYNRIYEPFDQFLKNWNKQ